MLICISGLLYTWSIVSVTSIAWGPWVVAAYISAVANLLLDSYVNHLRAACDRVDRYAHTGTADTGMGMSPSSAQSLDNRWSGGRSSVSGPIPRVQLLTSIAMGVGSRDYNAETIKKERVAKVDLVLRTKPQVGRRHRLTDSHTSNINVIRVGGGHRDLNSSLWQA